MILDSLSSVCTSWSTLGVLHDPLCYVISTVMWVPMTNFVLKCTNAFQNPLPAKLNKLRSEIYSDCGSPSPLYESLTVRLVRIYWALKLFSPSWDVRLRFMRAAHLTTHRAVVASRLWPVQSKYWDLFCHSETRYPELHDSLDSAEPSFALLPHMLQCRIANTGFWAWTLDLNPASRLIMRGWRHEFEAVLAVNHAVTTVTGCFLGTNLKTK